ncbi:hypothetical protein [Streptomyces vietnamensis]
MADHGGGRRAGGDGGRAIEGLARHLLKYGSKKRGDGFSLLLSEPLSS